MTASNPVTVHMLEQACESTDRVLSGVRADQLDHATPCGEWTIRELMEHIVSSTDFFADAAELGSVANDKHWPEYNPEDLVSAFRDHANRLVSAFKVPGVMERPMIILAGPPTASFCLQVAVSERLVHAWDLAVATGLTLRDEDSVIADALLASPEYVAVNDEVRQNVPAPFGPATTTGPASNGIDRLVAFLGRDPEWRAR